jgi:hypothetical protein
MQVTTLQVTPLQAKTLQVTTLQVTTSQVTTLQVTTSQVTTPQVTTSQVAAGFRIRTPALMYDSALRGNLALELPCLISDIFLLRLECLRSLRSIPAKSRTRTAFLGSLKKLKYILAFCNHRGPMSGFLKIFAPKNGRF